MTGVSILKNTVRAVAAFAATACLAYPVAAQAVAAFAATACLAYPVAAQAPELAMLDSLAKGAWTLRIRDNGSQQRICVRNGREFIQIRHRQGGCSQFVAEDGPNEVTVQYTCRGNGYGRTTIRKEGDRLVQIESTGIVDGTPFSITGEARHTGRC